MSSQSTQQIPAPVKGMGCSLILVLGLAFVFRNWFTWTLFAITFISYIVNEVNAHRYHQQQRQAKEAAAQELQRMQAAEAAAKAAWLKQAEAYAAAAEAEAAAANARATRARAEREAEQARARTYRQQTRGQPRNEPSSTRWTSSDPHTVLGIARNATQAEVRAAYMALSKQYHPDRVANLGLEFKELAEARMKAINSAYARLRQ